MLCLEDGRDVEVESEVALDAVSAVAAVEVNHDLCEGRDSIRLSVVINLVEGKEGVELVPGLAVCEHVIDATADFEIAVLEDAPGEHEAERGVMNIAHVATGSGDSEESELRLDV